MGAARSRPMQGRKKPAKLGFVKPAAATEPSSSTPANSTAPEAFTTVEDDNALANDLEEQGVLGSGSTGQVFKMRRKQTGEIFAVKVMPLGLEPAQREQIVSEIRMLHSASVCPQVVTFHSACYHNGAVMIVLEYMDGGTLAQLVERADGLPEPILARVTVQVLEALIWLHQKHLIHRDIKPGNLLYTTSGQVKLADLGVSGELASTLAETASWCGTMSYMSPERISGEAYSYPSDVWSLGITLMEVALRRFPYTPTTNEPSAKFWDLLHQIVEGPAPSLPQDQFSTDLRDFVTDCMAKSPPDRASARDLAGRPFIAAAADEETTATW